ncbi:hypothetical protein [Caballeronia sp. AZ7_KS35]|uniref:hypothetical protein n=1 Tax=Caballeronia sp. AZ7_KS35 TaxID=2921762 RepID=UPI0020281B29|nr:hypothetical protein [Caballeronia sp. AZ7_KS35]
MKVHIENQGSSDIRVIVDGDTVNDSTLTPGEAEVYATEPEGVVELRELGGGEAQDEASEDVERA